MPYPISFRTQLPGAMEATGDFDVFPDATVRTPQYSYNQGETIFIDFNWVQSGWLFNPLFPIPFGPWEVHVYLERQGPNDPSDPVPVVPSVTYSPGNPRSYDPTRYAIPTTGVVPGTFKVTLSACLMIGGRHLPFAGLAEGPLIQIHSAP